MADGQVVGHSAPYIDDSPMYLSPPSVGEGLMESSLNSMTSWVDDIWILENLKDSPGIAA
ncbi:hypothetical protein N7535_008085 [Penicillium sp. DV-2018c]|nr:hypothetical protein N7535_008085 [Penicillium sp. DV-2018c]